jgi:hypothetical protein
MAADRLIEHLLDEDGDRRSGSLALSLTLRA